MDWYKNGLRCVFSGYLQSVLESIAQRSASEARLSRCGSRRLPSEKMLETLIVCRLSPGSLSSFHCFCPRVLQAALYSEEIQSQELSSTWYVTCSFLSRNVKNSHRSVGSSTRLEQKLYNFLNVFTKHFICCCHRDDNPDKTSNADQVSATVRLWKEAWVFFCFFNYFILFATVNKCVFASGFERQWCEQVHSEWIETVM